MKKVMAIKAILIAIVTLVVFGQMVSAQQGAPVSADSLFARSARPGETLAQYLDIRRGEFRSFDADGDGAITDADLKLHRQIHEAGARAMALHTLLQCDFDGDGVVTRAEIEQFFVGNPAVALLSSGREITDADRQQLKVTIDKLMEPDTNGDGRIDSAEMLAYGEKRAIRYSGNPLLWVSLTLDENKDGGVTLDEYLKAAESAFHKVDSNGDGVQSKEEIDAFRKQQIRPPGAPK